MIVSIGNEECQVEQLIDSALRDARSLEQQIQALQELLVKKRRAVVMMVDWLSRG
jgi:hypothetical protein